LEKIDLKKLGWNDFFQNSFDSIVNNRFSPARVASEHRDCYALFTESGEMKASISGKLRFESRERGDLPAVGDWVAADIFPEEKSAIINAVLSRKSKFSRKIPGEKTEEQILAANIDTIFWVTSMNRDLNPRRIERFIFSAAKSGTEPVIIINKADLEEDPEQTASEISEKIPDIKVFTVSALNGYNFEKLMPFLKEGKTVAFLGTSGVGKSSIINRLAGEKILNVSEIRDKDQKGRHTTTVRQMIFLSSGGLVIDTPGIRELQIWESDGESGAFDDIEKAAENCRYRNCTHEAEPGCAVKELVEKGIIEPKRLENYKKMKKESFHIEKRTSQRAKLEEKRKGKILAKTIRRYFKNKKGNER